MDGRTVTNILLAIIAGALLFGGGAMVSGLTVALYIGIVLAIIAVIIWIVVSILRSLAREIRKEKSLIDKAVVPATYVGVGCLIISWIGLAMFMLEAGSWNFNNAIEKLMVDPWGVPMMMFLVGGFAWGIVTLSTRAGRAVFTSPAGVYRVNMVGEFVSAWMVLPFYLSIKNYQRAVASEEEPVFSAVVALAYGFIIWLFTIGIPLGIFVATIQNFLRHSQ